jgi:hypothetical protein
MVKTYDIANSNRCVVENNLVFPKERATAGPFISWYLPEKSYIFSASTMLIMQQGSIGMVL